MHCPNTFRAIIVFAAISVFGSGHSAEGQEPKLLRRFVAGRDDARAIAFSPDSKTLAVTIDDGTVTLWDVISGRKTATLQGHRRGLLGTVEFSPNGKLLASGGLDGTVRLWNIASQEKTVVLAAHNARVYRVAFSRDGKLLASGGGDGAARIWDGVTGSAKCTLGNYSEVWSVSFSPDGKTLITGGLGSEIIFWDIAAEKAVKKLDFSTIAASFAELTPNGKILFENSRAGGVQLWDAEKVRRMGMMKGHRYRAEPVRLAPDGRLLASVGMTEPYVRLWDVDSGTHVGDVDLDDNAIYGVAFSADEQMLATAQRGGTVCIWSIPTTWRKTSRANVKECP